MATAGFDLTSLKSSANSSNGGVIGATVGDRSEELLELLLPLGSKETAVLIPSGASHRDKQTNSV